MCCASYGIMSLLVQSAEFLKDIDGEVKSHRSLCMCVWFKMACDGIGSLRVTRVTAYRQRLTESEAAAPAHSPATSYHEFVCDSSLSFKGNHLAHSSSLYITLKIVLTPYRTFCLLPSIPKNFSHRKSSAVIIKPAALR